MLAAAAVSAGGTYVWAQDVQAWQFPDDAGYTLQQPTNHLVSTTSNVDGPADLGARVAELEKALLKMEGKAAAAAAKAAARPSVVVGGRIYADTVLFGQSELSRAVLGDAQDTTYFRTARIFVAGEAFHNIGYKLEVDFAGRKDFRDNDGDTTRRVGQTLFKDVYIDIHELPYAGEVLVGHFKEAFSLEELTSSRFITFMERSLANAFVPGRNMGVMAVNSYADQYGTWALGAFESGTPDNPPFRADDENGTAFTARATYLPWYDEASGGRGLLHLGLGYSYRQEDDDAVRFRARPEVGSIEDAGGAGIYIVDTGTINHVDNWQLFGPELAFVYGPFSIQSEYILATLNRGDGFADASFDGFYVQTSYFLTGEHRNYKRSRGAFDRVVPFTNFFRVRTADGNIAMGPGAWELAYRYSWLDLDDADAAIFGGAAGDHTLGVNWYLNPYTRMMFNYVHSRNTDLDVDINVFQMRAQIDF